MLYRCDVTDHAELATSPPGASPCPPCPITLVAVLDTVEDQDCAALSFTPARLQDTTFLCNGSQFVVQQVAKRVTSKRKKTLEVKFFRFNLPSMNLNSNSNSNGGFSNDHDQHKGQGSDMDFSAAGVGGLLGRLDKVRLEVTFENAASGMPVGKTHTTHPLNIIACTLSSGGQTFSRILSYILLHSHPSLSLFPLSLLQASATTAETTSSGHGTT